MKRNTVDISFYMIMSRWKHQHLQHLWQNQSPWGGTLFSPAQSMWLQLSHSSQHIISWYESGRPQTQLTSILMYLSVLPTVCRLLEASGKGVRRQFSKHLGNHNVMNHRDVMDRFSRTIYHAIAIIIPRKMVPHGVHFCKAYFSQVITTNSMVSIGNSHHSTFRRSSLLLDCNYCNSKPFIHHCTLINLADLLLQASWQLSSEFTVVQQYFTIDIWGCYPVLPFGLKMKLQGFR